MSSNETRVKSNNDLKNLLPYDTSYVPEGAGLPNFGNSCYFNSLLQCLLSCPSVFERLESIKKERHFLDNPIAVELYNFYNAVKKGENINQIQYKLWTLLIRASKSRQDRVTMQLGSQEDSHEGLMMIMSILDALPSVRMLFEHAYNTQIYCHQCKDISSDKTEYNLTFEVQSNLQTEQLPIFRQFDTTYGKQRTLEEFIKFQTGYVDEDYMCSKCKRRSPKFKKTRLVVVPEIICAVIKKYERKEITPFDEKMYFNAPGNKKLEYQLVAQSEHGGGIMGGHYWAICLRSDGWKKLNDSSVMNGKPGPTVYTYIVFYHYMRTIDNVNPPE